VKDVFFGPGETSLVKVIFGKEEVSGHPPPPSYVFCPRSLYCWSWSFLMVARVRWKDWFFILC